MKRLSFIADIHVGNPTAFGGPVVAGVNQRGRLVLDALERAVQEADGSDAIIICGDLFDTSNPSPQLIAEVQRILLTSTKVFVLMGNHDMVSDSPGDNALGPLSPITSIMPVEQPECFFFENTALLLVPFQAGDCREWFPKVVASLASTPMPEDAKRVLTFHLGVIDKETPSFLAKAHDAIEVEVVRELMEAHDIDFAFCGNWHSPRKWKAPKGAIIQCGALAPTGWDNPGWTYGKVWHLETETGLVSHRMIPGPRFLTVESMEDAEGATEKAQLEGHQLFLTLKGEASDAASLEVVREWGVKARAVADGEAAREATQAAAKAVKGAATLADALARYVREMPLEEGVDREQVRTLAQKYLSMGGTA